MIDHHGNVVVDESWRAKVSIQLPKRIERYLSNDGVRSGGESLRPVAVQHNGAWLYVNSLRSLPQNARVRKTMLLRPGKKAWKTSFGRMILREL